MIPCLLNRWIALGLAAMLLGGCAFRPQLHTVAIDHNRLVADTANELTLLNILRARDRQPMHYTSMNVLRGSVQASISGSAGALVEEGDLKAFSPSVGVGVVSNPSFDIAVYDKQEFQKGIMRPVEPALYQYFLGSGWPGDYLARLLIERIEFRASGTDGRQPGVLVGSLDNDPQDPQGGVRFSRFLAQYDIVIRTSRASPTPLAAASDLLGRSTLAELALLADGTLYVEEAGEHAGMVMRPSPVEYTAELVETDPDGGSSYACSEDDDAQSPPSSAARFQLLLSRDRPPAVSACTFNGIGVAPPLIVLRSPDAVMYFLGEYLRASGEADELRILRVWRERAPGFSSQRAVTRTRFMGEGYAILHEPDDAEGQPTGRSMQTLSFLQQLINLHKSSEELPVSSSVVVQQ